MTCKPSGAGTRNDVLWAQSRAVSAQSVPDGLSKGQILLASSWMPTPITPPSSSLLLLLPKTEHPVPTAARSHTEPGGVWACFCR